MGCYKKIPADEHLHVAKEILERRGCRVDIFDDHVRLLGGDDRASGNVQSAINHLRYGSEDSRHVITFLNDLGLTVELKDGYLIAF